VNELVPVLEVDAEEQSWPRVHSETVEGLSL
jgi:hypothetical protein